MNDPQAHNELKEFSPFLADLEKQNPFQIPDSYFTFLPDKIKNRITGNSLSREINEYEFVRKYKTDPYSSLKVPESYFENLPDVILQKAKKQTETPKPKGIQIIFRQYRGIAVAASVAAMLFLGMTLFHPSHKFENVTTTFKQEDLNQYIRQNITEFDEQIIASQVAEANTLQPVLIGNSDDSASYNTYLRDASGIDISEINNLQND